MPLAPAASVSGRRPARASTPLPLLPHWSDVPDVPHVPGEPPRPRPSLNVAAVLRDLVSWAADMAIVLTRGCPEDREAIERVRRYSHAWLVGETCPDISLEDVLTTTAALMAGIDRTLDRTGSDEDERHDLGAAVAA